MAKAKQTVGLIDVSAVVDRENEIEATVRTLLAKEATPENSLSPSERQFLRRQFLQEKPHASDSAFRTWLKGRVNKAASTLRLQRQAGTGAERQAAVESLETARQAEAERLPEIQELIAQLQAEARSLTDAVTQAAALIERQEKACTELRSPKRLPPDARQVLAQHHDQTRERKAELSQLESQLKSLEGLIKLDPDLTGERNHSTYRDGSINGDGSIYTYCHGTYLADGTRLSDLVYPRENRLHQPNLPEFRLGEWQRHVDELRVEAVELRKRIEALRPQVEADEARRVELSSVLMPQ